MKESKNRKLRTGIAMLALLLGAPAIWAQQKDPRVNPPAPPLPAAEPAESSSKTPGGPAASAAEPEKSKQDSRSLSSAEAWTPGGSGARNYVLPALSIYQSGDTNPGNQGSPELEAATTLTGELALHRLWGRNEFTGSYRGGGTLYSSSTHLNNWFQQFDFSQKFRGRRWTLLVADRAEYAQDPSGFGSFTSGGLPGGLGSAVGRQLVDLNSAVLPNQTILTTRAARLSNTILGEWQYQSSRRSTLTLTGSYGLLHFLDDGFIDGTSSYFGAGYDYLVTPYDTLAVSYRANLFRYRDFDQTTDSHAMYLTYGRRITGRLALQLGAGPQVTLLDRLGVSETILSWSVQSSLRYRFPGSELGLTYARAVTGGAGVFLGAQTHDVGLSWSQRLSRTWESSLDFGYARNEPFQSSAAGFGDRTYDTWRGGVRLGRSVGRYTRVTLNYGVERQASQSATCVGTACGLVGLRHIFGIGFNFRFRPVNID